MNREQGMFVAIVSGAAAGVFVGAIFSYAQILIGLAFGIMVASAMFTWSEVQRLKLFQVSLGRWLRERSAETTDTDEASPADSLWKEYLQRFHSDSQRTSEPANSVFSLTRIARESNSDWSLILPRVIPNALLGIGIGFTFLGLIIGIGNFDTTSAESIRSGVESLFGGMNLAFVTSLMGIAFSIFMRFVVQRYMSALLYDNRSLCEELDRRFYVNEIDLLREALTAQGEALTAHDSEGNRISVAEAGLKTAEHADKQTSLLQNFNTDLADTMENLSQDLLERQKQEMFDVYREEMLPVLNQIVTVTEQLKEERQESTSEAVGNIVQELQQSMQSMVGEFKQSLSGETKTELSQLAEQLSSAGSAFNDIPDMLDMMKQELRDQHEKYTEVMGKMLTSFETQIEKNSALAEELRDIGENVHPAVQQLQSVSDGFYTLSNEVKQLTERYVPASERLYESADGIVGQLQTSTDSFQKVSASLGQVDDSLGGVLAKLQKGMNDYQNVVSKSLDDYLSNYTSSLNKWAQQMQSTTGQLHESIEELSDALSNGRHDSERG